MNNRIEVVLDVDGVLADLEGYFCDVFGYEHRQLVGLEKRYPKKRPKIVNFVQDRETYRYLDPLPLGLEIARYLQQSDAIIHIVSSRPNGTFAITKEWLNSYHVPYTSLTVKPDKIATINSIHPFLIVDDIISVVEGCYQAQSILGILVAHPWNADSTFFPRVENIQDFITVYSRLVDANVGISRTFQPR